MRAAEFGASHVELKLMKCNGIRDMVNLVEFVNSVGLSVISGNGFATEATSILENSIHLQLNHLSSPSEAIGFRKFGAEHHMEMASS